MNKLTKVLVTTTLLVSSANAFTFDMWKSGYTMDNSIVIAKSKNIPLSKKGAVNTSSNFEKKSLKGYDKTRELRYITSLLGKKSLVTLTYTDEGKKLYNLRVKWILNVKDAKDFQKRTKKMLSAKYRGAVKKQKLQNGMDITEWYLAKNIIGLRSKGKLIEIYYIDSSLKWQNDKDKETTELFKDEAVKF